MVWIISNAHYNIKFNQEKMASKSSWDRRLLIFSLSSGRIGFFLSFCMSFICFTNCSRCFSWTSMASRRSCLLCLSSDWSFVFYPFTEASSCCISSIPLILSDCSFIILSLSLFLLAKSASCAFVRENSSASFLLSLRYSSRCCSASWRAWVYVSSYF